MSLVVLIFFIEIILVFLKCLLELRNRHGRRVFIILITLFTIYALTITANNS